MAENSPIRPPGVGKTSKRHDLDGTPGLSNSSLQYGDVKALESGQASVQNTVGDRSYMVPQATQQQQQMPQGTPASSASMPIPDPVQFAAQKLKGTAANGMAGKPVQINDQKRWLPFLQRIATSPTSSGVLQRAYIQRLSNELNAPAGGGAAVIRQRDLDKRLREFNDGS